MKLNTRIRALLFALLIYLVLCSTAGVLIADHALRPARRPLTHGQQETMREIARRLNADLEDVSVVAPDNVVLRAWLVRPEPGNGDAVVLLHGLGDNRFGMSGYAQLFLAHGYSVLMPDARAHGASGGEFATYGLLERNDIHRWFDFVAGNTNAQCIFGFGESMGAAQLLQSLDADVPFCAVAAESPFSSFREVACDRMGQPFHLGPWFGRIVLRPVVEAAFLRARWKYKFRMSEASPEVSVARARIPILLIHGEIDGNIPVRHSRRIHERNPKTILWEVPRADHGGAVGAAPQEFEQKVMALFSTATSQPSTTGN